MSRDDTSNPAGRELIATCGDIVVINLPHRADRRTEFAAQLRRIGLSFDDPHVHLHAAFRPEAADGFPSIGARGCFISHLQVLKGALASGAERVLICEDDLDFTEAFGARLSEARRVLDTQPWDIFYGFLPEATAHSLPPGQTAAVVPLAPEQPVICAHFVSFSRQAVESLVPYLEAILTRQPGDPAGGPMHVDGAYNRFRAEHPEIRGMAARVALGIQRASTTDIAEQSLKDRLPVVRDLMRLARRLKNARGRHRGGRA